MRPGGSELQPYEKALHVLPPTFNGRSEHNAALSGLSVLYLCGCREAVNSPY